MYPMRMIPVEKDYLWGGNRLRRYGGRGRKIAEIWALSCHEAGESRVANGVLAGMSLKKLLEGCPGWVGRENPAPDRFPVLVKLIDAREPLSVQVHPAEETAAYGEQGKAEMWYILEAEPGAFIYCGLRRTLTAGELTAHAEAGTITGDLNRVSVHPGEHYYIAPGTIHALGAGVLLAEIQQNSDTTLRLYDYGRRDADGNPRPLQTERAAEAARKTAGFPETADSAFRLSFPGFCLE